MMFVIRFVFSALVLTFAAFPVAAQSFDEVLAAAQNDVGDIAKYQEALQNPDQRFQYAMVQQMLKLPDPALQRIAKEHALFSTNPVMREAAIKAILDSGATLRLQIAGNEAENVNIIKFVRSTGGVYSGGLGAVLVKTPDAVSEACWGTRDCLFRQVGNTIQYNPSAYIAAVLTLGNDGVLRGNINYTWDKAPEVAQIQIDLKE